MRLIETIDEVEYPETDGQPVAETELHLDWMVRIREILRWRYRGQRVYVGCDMFVYYVKDRPDKNLAPDVFVVRDCDPGRRRVFKTWEEERSPDVVFEVTSRGTKQEDEVYKPQVFAQIGVEEYFLFDPEVEYLDPPLQGFRLANGDYTRIEADTDGALRSRMLGVNLHLVDGELLMRDSETGEVLLTEAEAKEEARQQAEAARQRAESARKAEQARAETAERQLQQLQAEMEDLRQKLKNQDSAE